jgi:RNA polymerase sigma factor (sigma-70 family)
MAATAVPVRSSRRGRRRQRSRVGDERLVAKVRAGDHDAFEAIYDRYYLGLLAFCRHMLGSRDEAEDALQQSFASAYRALRDGTGVVDLRPWLYAIARNRCLSALRAQRDEVTVDAVDLSAPFDGLPAEIARRAELRELVEDLQRLPDDQRAALVLFELGDQCHGQIAEALGVRREKVKALVFQAREALLRARRAREASCSEIREQLSSLTGDVPRRGILRGHIERCPGCAAFELEVRSQRAAFSAILPVAPTVGLKASVLALFGGGGAAAAGGAGVSAGAGAGAGAGAAAVAGSVAAGGTTVGIASLGGKAVVAKALAVVALAGGASDAKVHRQHAPQGAAAPHVRQHALPREATGPAVSQQASSTRAAPTVAQHRGSKVATGESVKPAPTSAPAQKSPASSAATNPAAQSPHPAASPLEPSPTPAPPARATPSATAPASDSAPATTPTAPTQTAPASPTTTPSTTDSAPATTSTPATTATPSASDPATTTPTAAPAAATDTTQSAAAPLASTVATDAGGTSAPAAATP